MTNSTIVRSFLANFDCDRLIRESIDWELHDLPYLKAQYESIVATLAAGGLEQNERSQLYIQRDSLKEQMVKDDPACVMNSVFDQWLRNTGLYDNGYSENENRYNNKRRLNRLFQEENHTYRLHNKGYKGHFYIMDRLQAAIYDSLTIHETNTNTIANRCEDLRDELSTCGDLYGMDREFITELKSPIRTMAIRQEHDNTEHIQICEVMDEHVKLLQEQRQKLLGTTITV